MLTILWEDYGIHGKNPPARETSGIKRLAIMHDDGVNVSPQFQRALNRVCQRRQIGSQNRAGANSSGANARGCWPTASSQCLHPIGIARVRRAPAGLPRADAIKRANPASWKHVNLYGAYSFLDIGDGCRPPGIYQSLGGSRGRGHGAGLSSLFFDTN